LDFNTLLAQVVGLLRQRQRVTYRALQRQLQRDDAALQDLKGELLSAHPQVRDDEGQGLLWTGDPAQRHVPVPIPLALSARARHTMVHALAPPPWCGALRHRAVARQPPPAMTRRSALRHEAHAMATMVTRSAPFLAPPFLAPPFLAGVARLLLLQRGAGPRLSAVRAAASLEAALGDRTRPTPLTLPAPWRTP
jgi:hypothetical protein